MKNIKNKYRLKNINIDKKKCIFILNIKNKYRLKEIYLSWIFSMIIYEKILKININ